MKPYYADDLVTLYHGDCLDALPSLDPVDLIVTSPPYNLGTSTGGGFAKPGNKTGTWSGGPLASGYENHGDNMDPEEYKAWQADCLRAYWASITPTGAIFYNHKPRVQAGVVSLPTEWNPGLPIRQIVVWDRGGGMNWQRTHFLPVHEWIIVFAGPDFRLVDGGNRLTDVWRFPYERDVDDHPAPFPVTLPARAIASTGPSVVLDPMAGSGTTLRAAKDLGVRSIGIEKSERYCEIAVRRLAQESLDFGGAA